MKSHFFRFAVLGFLLVLLSQSNKSFSQIITYDGATNGSLGYVDPNASGTGLTRVNGAQGDEAACNRGFSSSNFSSAATFNESLPAIQTSVTANTGFSMNIKGFTLELVRSGKGPGMARLAYSIDGGANWTVEGSDQSVHPGPCDKGYSITWQTSFSVTAPDRLIFRIYGFDANKSDGSLQISNLTIEGNVQSVTPTCNAASGLSVSNITSSSATLNWNDVSGATGYNIQYRASGSASWTSGTSTTSSLSVTGLSSSTTYEFQVQTVCSGGATSGYSSSATFTTAAAACGSPSGLSASNITTSLATLNWNDVSGATGYNIQYRASGSAAWTSGTSTTSLLSVTGLSSSTTYEFQVQTVCSGGATSGYSSSATFTTAAASCTTPSGLSGKSITSSSATLDWNDVSGATGYNIQYRASGAAAWTSGTSTTSSLSVTGLSSSTTYEFQVQTVCSGGATSGYSSSATFTTAAGPVSNTIPTPDHVVVLILENHSYSSIIGSSAAPHINALANDANSASFTQAFAIERPSQPNYLDLYSGSNQGVTDNNVPVSNPFTTPNLGRELIDASLSFATYSESLPSVGYNGATSGAYARKHNPAANWMGTGTNQIPATTNQPFTAFPSDFTKLPTVSYVVPNQDNDMHNGSDPTRITVADDWMYNNLNNYIEWAKTHNSLFILTFDEDNGTENNRIVTIFNGPMVAGGKYSNHVDLFSILRTIEDMYKLPHAGKATSNAIDFCWKTSSLTTSNNSASLIEENANAHINIFPNPAYNKIYVELNNNGNKQIDWEITDIHGKRVKAGKIANVSGNRNEILLDGFSNGIYFFRTTDGKNELMKKFVIAH